VVFFVAAAGGFAAAHFWHAAQRRPPPPALLTGTILEPRRALPDFSLLDEHGLKFTRADLLGHWSMLFFGYTNCPDLCPTTLAMLAAMAKSMRAAADPVRPRIVFVSVDARRDTPAQLARYVPYFDPSFIGVTAADQKTVEAFALKLGVVVLIVPQADGGYSVDHSGSIFVADPRGRLAAVLSGPFTAAKLRSDLRTITAAGS